MIEARKQAISLRLGSADIRRIKKLAARLGASESDVVRFAVKMMLHKMLPLTNPALRGRDLVPLLAELGVDAIRHFELDSQALDEIVNSDAAQEDRVDRDDLALLTMFSAQESYASLRLRALLPPSRPPATGDRRGDNLANTLRRHFYSKYGIYATVDAAASPGEGGKAEGRHRALASR